MRLGGHYVIVTHLHFHFFIYMYFPSPSFSFLHIYVNSHSCFLVFTYICISFTSQNTWNVFVVRKGGNWGVLVLGDAYKFSAFLQHHLRQHVGFGPHDHIDYGECVCCCCRVCRVCSILNFLVCSHVRHLHLSPSPLFLFPFSLSRSLPHGPPLWLWAW